MQNMSNRIIIVPDVHGRSFWRKVLNDKKDHVVFLGDYSDPYDSESITHGDALRELADIVKFKEENPDRVTLLLGNHDGHYIDNQFACSRYSYQNEHQYQKFYIDKKKLFDIAFEVKQNHKMFLFTHAGVTAGFANTVKLDLDKNPVDELKRLYKESPFLFYGMVSYHRGGDYKYGSPLWADIDEHNETGAFHGYQQIFGHTQFDKDAVVIGNMFCVDCRNVFILEDGVLKEY